MKIFECLIQRQMNCHNPSLDPNSQFLTLIQTVKNAIKTNSLKERYTILQNIQSSLTQGVGSICLFGQIIYSYIHSKHYTE